MRKIYFVLFAFLFSLSSFCASEVRDYYVGNCALPNSTHHGYSWDYAFTFSEMSSLWDNLVPGDRVFIDDDTYNNLETIRISVNASSNNPVLIASGYYSPYPSNHSGTVMLQAKSTTNYLFDISGANYVTIKGFTIVDPIISGVYGAISGTDKVENCSIINCTISTRKTIADLEEKGKCIWLSRTKFCSVSSCTLNVYGLSGISLDQSMGALLENNRIITEGVNDIGDNSEWYYRHQVDCIAIGGLGTGESINNVESIKIVGNYLQNNSNCGDYDYDGDHVFKDLGMINGERVYWGRNENGGHDDCIQFYVDGNTKKYYGSSTYPFRVSIFRNWIELKGADDPKNTGIIIGGWSDNNDWNQTNEEIAWREGQFTEWGIWSNIFRSVKNTGLLNINRMDANALYMFNNSFYTETTAGPQLVIYNTWRNVLRNAKIVNNIYSSGNSTYPLFKYGSYSTVSGTGYPCVSTTCYTDAPTDMGKSLHNNATDRGNSFINYNIYYPSNTTSNAILNGHNSIHSSATSYCCLGPNCPGDTEEGYTLAAWKSLYNNATYNFTENNGKQIDPGYESWPPVNPEDFMLKLQKTYPYVRSQGIDYGTTDVGMQWTDYNKTYDGYTRGDSPWDMGAYEKHWALWSPPRDGFVQGSLDAYPSPFNPTTTISYVIPKDSKVSLKVYNVLGKEISTLVDEYKTAGPHSVTFNGEDLSSGIYIYVLNSDGYYNIKKMILLK